MKTLLVSRQGSVIRAVGGQFRVESAGEVIATYPADLVEEVVILGGVSVTTPALRDLMARGGTLHVLTLGGRHLGAAGAGLRGQVALLRAQVHVSDDPARTLTLARQVIHGKLRNSRATLQRYRRAQATVLHTEAVESHDQALDALPTVQSLDTLLGVEGIAARSYFQAFRATLPAVWQDGPLGFHGRARRPAPDPTNALLSFGYALLRAHVLSDLLRTGLHPAMGVLHAGHGARPALALDLMEEHRAPLVDRLVFRLLNRRELVPLHFQDWNGTPRLTAEGRSLFLTAFAARIEQPVSGVATYRDLIARQVKRYAEAVRDGTDYRSAFLK